MSLINKMLYDLEKRDASLYENQDIVLDGLYSAYDLESQNKNNQNSYRLSLILISIISLITATSYYLYANYSLQAFSSNNKSHVVVPEQVFVTVKNESSNDSLIVSKKENVTSTPGLLKLDESLLIATPAQPVKVEYSSSSNSIKVNSSLNKIDRIFFEEHDQGINLVMKLPKDIDYLVYGLDNPNRVVIEVENAELGFLLEEFEPVGPIVAIRYSVNKENRFKLVLETDEPLTIRKTTSSKDNNLVVFMDYQSQSEIIVNSDNNLPNNDLYDFVDNYVEQEKDTVYKGEVVKTQVNQNVNAYAEKLFRQAYNDYKNGDVSSSLKKLNMALDHDATHINARSTLATILSKQGHTELAYSVLNEGLIQNPNQTEWIKVYARLLLNEDKLVEAKEVMVKHNPTLSVNVEYYALKAAILQKLNEHNESAIIYRDLLQFNPLKSVWWMGLAISLESLKRYQDALYAYQKASKNPSLANDSRDFINQRIHMLSKLLKDEST